MAVVATYKLEGGGIVRIHDDCFEKDQEAAWSHARNVNEETYWAVRMRKMDAKRAAEAAAACTEGNENGDGHDNSTVPISLPVGETKF